MSMRSRSMLASALLILFSCKNNNKPQESITEPSAIDTVSASDTKTSPFKEITTSTGKTIILEESHPVGASLSDFTVYFKGDTTSRLSLSDQDPMSSHVTADLDKNGYDELYIFTTSAGSGSYGKVCGFASNNDRSFSFVYFPELTEKEIQKGQPFEGYEGKDTFSIKEQQLVRSFEVTQGGEKKIKNIYYSLQKTETGFTLRPNP